MRSGEVPSAGAAPTYRRDLIIRESNSPSKSAAKKIATIGQSDALGCGMNAHSDGEPAAIIFNRTALRARETSAVRPSLR
jgi:hypothetical protein